MVKYYNKLWNISESLRYCVKSIGILQRHAILGIEYYLGGDLEGAKWFLVENC